MLAANGESSVIMNDDVVFSLLSFVGNPKDEEPCPWMPPYISSKFSFRFSEKDRSSSLLLNLDAPMEFSPDDDSFENLLDPDGEFFPNDLDGFLSNTNSDMSPGI